MVWFRTTLERYGDRTPSGYRDLVAPWVSMPTGSEAERRAALIEVELAIAGVRCALELLGARSSRRLQQPVIGLVLGELLRVEVALRRIG